MVRSNITASERVVQAVATETNTDPLELPPLYETVDPDALDAIANVMSDGEVRFRYAGCTVTVESSGAVQIDVHLTSGDSVSYGGYDVPP